MDIFERALQSFSSGEKVKYFRLAKAGDEAVIRFLIGVDDLKARWGAMFHTVPTYRNGKVWYAPVKCWNENEDSPAPGQCPVCKVRDANGRPNYPGPMAFVPILLLGIRSGNNPPEIPEENDRLRIWQMRRADINGLGVVLKDKREEDETWDIDQQDFRVQRLGEKASTSYYFSPKKKTPLLGEYTLPDPVQWNKYLSLEEIQRLLGQEPEPAPAAQSPRSVNPFI
ncbi:MAG: hypothetical protein K6V97_06660 [Actinomycetia bacterium]|nr:hypothetical protein [Actinomycetes bacterium]